MFTGRYRTTNVLSRHRCKATVLHATLSTPQSVGTDCAGQCRYLTLLVRNSFATARYSIFHRSPLNIRRLTLELCLTEQVP
jgi:hypothetical protein